MTNEQMAALRAEFKPEQIGKLPKPTKRDNPKGRCAECGGYHGLPALHLDYVGHAAVTDRIISVDPDYEFGPVLDINKRPIKDQDGSVLHYLTIGGSTKYEWGDGPNMKEVSSDAIRRCAMRFGVALDLWAKEPLQGETVEPVAPPKASTPEKRLTASQKRIVIAASENGISDELRHRITLMVTEGAASSAKDVPSDQIDRVVRSLEWFAAHTDESQRKLEEWEARQAAA